VGQANLLFLFESAMGNREQNLADDVRSVGRGARRDLGLAAVQDRGDVLLRLTVSTNGQAPNSERVVSDHDDAAQPEVLLDLREVRDQNASQILHPAPDHPADEHDRRAEFVGGGEQCTEVRVGADQDTVVVCALRRTTLSVAARRPRTPT
jgi:hypothetical protein